MSLCSSMSTGDWDLFRARGKWRGFSPGAAVRHSQSAKAHTDFRKNNFLFRKTALACSEAKAPGPALAARPVPWNGRGRRLVEETEGSDSGGDSRGLPG